MIQTWFNQAEEWYGDDELRGFIWMKEDIRCKACIEHYVRLSTDDAEAAQ
jgi:hypothetical protein